jgi:two-component system, LuxR family, sensor kinase FixL
VTVPDPEVAQHLYRIAGEAVSNAVRHARASRITVALRREEEELLLEIRDDGIGLPEPRPTGGLGLRTMAYRAQLLGGALSLEPLPAGGTRVSCLVARRLAVPTAGTSPQTEGASADDS